MAAGNFRPTSAPRRVAERFGLKRDSAAQGLPRKQGWTGATSVWVDCRAFIWSYDGNVYDITDDIISGSLSRNTDAPTTMTISFANEGDKYRQMFIPNDRIVLWLRRNETEWQSFTGYIHATPVFNLYTHRELTLECSCIIRRLNQKFWDPAARENIYVLSSRIPGQDPVAPEAAPDPATKEGAPAPKEVAPDPEPGNALANAEPFLNTNPLRSVPFGSDQPALPAPAPAPTKPPSEPDNTLPPDDPTTPEDESVPQIPPSEDPGAGEINTPDMTLAFLLTAPDHIGLKPESVLIQKFPDKWKEEAAAITAKNIPCATQWKDLIICKDDEPENCGGSPGGGPAGGPAAQGCPDGLTVGQVVELWPEGEREFAAAILWCESTGVTAAFNDTPEGKAAGGPLGLFQIVLTTAQGIDPEATPEKLMDPLYNADIAHKLWNQVGWTIWECATRPGGPKSTDYGHEKDPITGCKEGSAVANVDGGFTLNAEANAGCDESQWDLTATGAETHNHSAIIQKVVADVTSKWNTYTNTYIGHPGGEQNSVDFWGPTRRGDDIANFAPMGQEIFDHLMKTYGNQINWIIWNGIETYSGGERPDPSGFGHYDHVHVTIGSNDCGGATISGGGGGGTGPDGAPCGSGSPGEVKPQDTTKPPPPDGKESTTPLGNAIAANSESAALGANHPIRLTQMLLDSRNLLGIPFTWGGGHGKNLKLRKDSYGVDASGLFNLLRFKQNLEPAEVGSVNDYFKYLEDVREFDPYIEYPVGTILINPGDENTMGHMGMVITKKGIVLEANATGRVMADMTIQRSDAGWAGYTHTGFMPDVGREESPLYFSHAQNEADKRRHEQWLEEYHEAQNRTYAEDEESPIVYCSTHPENTGLVTVQVVNDWDDVGSDKKMYIRNRTKYASFINTAMAQWNGLGGVQILPTDGKRVDLDIYDGDREGSVLATTSSEGWMEFDVARMDGATDNAKQSVATHEMGHALRLGHAPSSESSVMQPVITTNSSSNPSSPTEYDVKEYKSVWGGTGQPGEAPVDVGGSGTSNVDAERCITKHPLGVYKLASNAVTEAGGESTLLADYKRYLALSNGNMAGGPDFLGKDYDLDSYGYFPELFRPCTEQREWRHLAELNKESYMRTVQDIADAGMYTMMSIGTGEIVFWYPWIIGEIADDVAAQGAEGAAAAPENKDRDDDIISYADNSLTGSLKKSAKKEIAANKEFSGIGMGETNAHVLSDKFSLTDTDLLDFSLYVSDDALVTHYYVLGEYRLEGGTYGGIVDLQCWRWSTIFDNPVIKYLMNNTANFDPLAFIQRYGVRSKQDTVKAIKIPGMAQIWADQQFIKQWINCYTIQLKTTFLPELYPGTHLVIESLGIEVIVIQANHTFGSEWSTQLTVSMPLRIYDSTRIPPLPFWTLLSKETVEAGLNPTGDQGGPAGGDPGVTDPFGTPIEISGDLWESIQKKRDADNKRVRLYLDTFTQLNNGEKGIGFKEVEKFVKDNPVDTNAPPPKKPPPPKGAFTPDELKKIFEKYPNLKGKIESRPRETLFTNYPELKLLFP